MDEFNTAVSTFPPQHRIRAASGFALIEVLVTLIILSIGLLGMAALQIRGLRATHAATLTTQAVTLASDVAEQLRTHHRSNLSADEHTAWLARVAAALPQGDGDIDDDAGVTVVSIAWFDRDEARRFSLVLRP